MFVPPQDFTLFWAGFHVLMGGGNPYDPAQLQALLSNVGSPYSATPIYYSPLLFLILAPILALPLEWASLAMMSLNFILPILIVRISAIVLGAWISPLRSALLALIFPPVVMAIILGQSSSIVAASLVVTVYLHRKGFLSAAGITILPALLKPHLVSLVLIYLALKRGGINMRFILAALASLAAASIAVEYIFPGVHANYLKNSQDPLIWLGHSPVTALRLAFDLFESKVLAFLPFGIAAVMVVSGRLLGRIEGIDHIILLTCISALVTPYIWIMDFVTLLPAVLAISIAGERWKAAVYITSALALVISLELGINWQSWLLSVAVSLAFVCSRRPSILKSSMGA